MRINHDDSGTPMGPFAPSESWREEKSTVVVLKEGMSYIGTR